MYLILYLYYIHYNGMDITSLLKEPIAEIGLSPEFCRQAKEMGFDTIGDVIQLTPDEIRGKRNFSYSWLGELSEYLNSKGLLYLLQPIPGRKYD